MISPLKNIHRKKKNHISKATLSDVTHYKKPSFEKMSHTLKQEIRVLFLTFSFLLSPLIWENRQNVLPRYGIITICQTPRFINPSVMKTTDVVSTPSPCHYFSLEPDSQVHKPKRNENNMWFSPPDSPCHYFSLEPDSEVHKPKRNENNRCGFHPLPLPLFIARTRLRRS